MIRICQLILKVFLIPSIVCCQTKDRIQVEKKTEQVNFQGKEYSVSKVESSFNRLIESDEYSGVIFSKDYKVYYHFSLWILKNDSSEKKVTRFDPKLEDIVKAESILKRCVEIDKVDADSMSIQEGRLYELPEYYRQYFGAINEKGEKLIWINCFKKPKNISGTNLYDPEWKVKLVSVDDGGKAYFNIEVNLKTDQCYNFFRNSIGG